MDGIVKGVALVRDDLPRGAPRAEHCISLGIPHLAELRRAAFLHGEEHPFFAERIPIHRAGVEVWGFAALDIARLEAGFLQLHLPRADQLALLLGSQRRSVRAPGIDEVPAGIARELCRSSIKTGAGCEAGEGLVFLRRPHVVEGRAHAHRGKRSVRLARRAEVEPVAAFIREAHRMSMRAAPHLLQWILAQRLEAPALLVESTQPMSDEVRDVV